MAPNTTSTDNDIDIAIKLLFVVCIVCVHANYLLLRYTLCSHIAGLIFSFPSGIIKKVEHSDKSRFELFCGGVARIEASIYSYTESITKDHEDST